MNILKSGILSCATVVLTACATAPDLAMRLENTRSEPDVLIGYFDGPLALIHGDPKNATLSATDGRLECNGTSDNGDFSFDMTMNKVRHNFDLVCNDGRTGNLILTVNARPNGYGIIASGAGVGELSDGTKVRVVVGDASGTLAW